MPNARGAATQPSNMVSCQQLRRVGASLWCCAVPRQTGWIRAQTFGNFHSRPLPTGRKQRDDSQDSAFGRAPALAPLAEGSFATERRSSCASANATFSAGAWKHAWRPVTYSLPANVTCRRHAREAPVKACDSTRAMRRHTILLRVAVHTLDTCVAQQDQGATLPSAPAAYKAGTLKD